MFGSGNMTITYNEKMNDIMEIVKPLKESGLLINYISRSINIFS